MAKALYNEVIEYEDGEFFPLPCLYCLNVAPLVSSSAAKCVQQMAGILEVIFCSTIGIVYIF